MEEGTGLLEWDKHTAPQLGRIEYCMMRAEYYFDQAVMALSELKQRPKFETKAEASLESMLRKLVEARNKYLAKPE